MDLTSPIFCPKSNPKVTAGLIWHPLTCPMDWAMVATVTPKAKAILWRKPKRYTNTKQHIYMGSRSISSECVRGVSGVSQDTPIFQDLLYEIHQKKFQKFYVLR